MTDRTGFVEFVEAASDSLHRAAYLMCGDSHRADDIMQDVLYKLYLAWPRVSRADNVFAYARRAVVNAAIDSGKRGWRREQSRAELPDGIAPDCSAEYVRRDAVLRALAQLPPRQRACLVLRYFQDLSIEQTAEAMRCSTGTVKSHTFRALANLRPLLETEAVTDRATGKVAQ